MVYRPKELSDVDLSITLPSRPYLFIEYLFVSVCIVCCRIVASVVPVTIVTWANRLRLTCRPIYDIGEYGEISVGLVSIGESFQTPFSFSRNDNDRLVFGILR